MAGSGAEQEFARLLRRLKERSGRSYEDLAGAAFISSSTLHRYCNGRSVPPDIGVVVRVARECGAGSKELQELLRAWAAIDAERRPPPAAPDGPPATSAVPAAAASPSGLPYSTSPVPAPDPVPGQVPGQVPIRVPAFGRRARRWIRLVSLLVGLVWVTASGSAAGGTPRPPQGSRAAPQWVSGPSWVRAPAPVDPRMFGVTMNSDTGTMPAFRIGAVRFWDSETRWADIQPRRGEYDWATLDRLVAGASRAGLPALYVFGAPPSWAAPRAPLGPYGDQSRAAGPDDLADWDAFVRAVVSRYRGKIEAYELWVMANDPRFFNGRVETMVEMTRRASGIIRKADSRATVVCPGMGRLWERAAQEVLRRFADLGGYKYCDAAGIKLHQRRPSDPPETMLEIVRLADRAMHEAGVHPPLWNTGTTYEIPLQGSLDDQAAVDHAVRFYLVGLYGTNLNLRRMYFYNWGGTKIPIVLQAEGGAPTRAALAVEQLQRWLAHARLRDCGRGLPIDLPDNVWQCEFTVEGPRGARPAVVRWTHSGTADTVAPPGAVSVHRLDGAVTAVRPGDAVRITEEPILIEYG